MLAGGLIKEKFAEPQFAESVIKVLTGSDVYYLHIYFTYFGFDNQEQCLQTNMWENLVRVMDKQYVSQWPRLEIINKA
jgi:hypothetical protein